ncbi:hypothetical protein T4E_4004 [Trichinella pseudospiralis]|uniref:Uncharacterized protein n=1 Tax=Trichinella pseudospiralis TaxID=6337 RepID=A0A0V0XUU3_TRIPS|nr:hypothetical protein T4E_4004 [Trichinella pseudospiralis]
MAERRPLSELDALNDTLRQKQRQSVVFSPSMLPPEEEMIELRYISPIPAEPQAHKLIVSVLSLNCVNLLKIKLIFLLYCELLQIRAGIRAHLWQYVAV